MITSINNFPSISSLETLSISNNSINDLTSFINAARIKYPQLKSINTFKNPMNPGVSQPSAYNQYKAYIRQIGKITEIDGMNINDNSFMNQQQQPKRDLFGTSTAQQPKRDLFGTTSTTTKVNFFDTPTNNNPTMNTNTDSTMFSNAASNNTNNSASGNPLMGNNLTQTSKPKMGLFDNIAVPQNNSNQNSMPTNAGMNRRVSNSSSMNSSGGENPNGIVYKRQFFVIDESAEIDGTEFVNSKKKKSLIMVNEKILKKSDNMTKFNRKNKSEGNKHILNSDL